ncbi:hypothetical protein QBC46DRAFT_131265 [Diplogelasinospora grovesii]|uniref:Uncharacterized protein n=1 Tax=Diplogelasinospora grovesii TaxID=303347 RepID=A0AAN6S8H7_9PEZI|nr:hypothetical protein QBC46DRAFT_131265 [Diplogelasinospora grovesii]
MSLVDQSLPTRDADHTNDSSYTRAPNDRLEQRDYSSHEPYDESVYDRIYEMDEHDTTLAPSPKRTQTNEDKPALPQKSALRASRLLDNLGLKLGGAIETTTELGRATTPLDIYLSSEEDASSDADDFSDYAYDSEDAASPTRRSSHEDTARVVSVVFFGKPSIVDLSLRRRSISPTSTDSRKRSSTMSSLTKSPVDRPSTSASSISIPSIHQQPPSGRKSSLLSDIMSKKRPPFLNIDPYANGSTYSLEIPQRTDSPQQDISPVKTPRTPTAMLKGVSRTLSLVRKRSRPLLNGLYTTQSQILEPSRDSGSFSATASPDRRRASTFIAPPPVPEDHHYLVVDQSPITPRTPMTPMTYNDMVKAAKKNSMMMPPQPTEQSPISPLSPGINGNGPKRGILSGLAARRRSIKLTGKAYN